MKAIKSIDVTDDGSILVDFKSNLIVKSDGHQIFYSPDSYIVMKSDMIELNPQIYSDINNINVNNCNNYIDCVKKTSELKKEECLQVIKGECNC